MTHAEYLRKSKALDKKCKALKKRIEASAKANARLRAALA